MIHNLLYQIGETLPLRALDYLHVGTRARGSSLKQGTVTGHGWVEHDSSQVIRLIDLSSEFPMFLLMLCS